MSAGQVINSPRPGSTVVGGGGDDTLVASNGPDVLTGAGGADLLRYSSLPYNAGHVSDFTLGQDRLDLNGLLGSSSYHGTDPVADGYVILQSDGAGGTEVLYDTDGPGANNTIQYRITDLDHVTPNGLTWSQIGVLPDRNIYLQIHSAGVVEGSSGTMADTYTVVRTGPADAVATVHWSVVQVPSEPTPQADDFVGGVLPSGDITFNPGETSKTFVIPIAGDTRPEFQENFLVHLSNATGATLVGSDAGDEIYDDDGPTNATFGFTTTSVSHPEGNSGSTDFTFTVTRGGPTDVTTHAGWQVLSGGTATADDFVGGALPRGTVAFGVGETSKTITIQVAGDTVTEADEVFGVSLSDIGGQGYRIVNSAQGTIANDDGGASPPPPPPPSGGQVITADDSPGQHLTGGAGNDTLNAGHNSVIETGAGGSDVFAFGDTPWNAGHITDFTVGTDRLDFSALFQASGYTGSDPIAEGYVSLQPDGSGGTNVFYDTDGPASGNTIQFKVTDLDHVAPIGLSGAQLAGSGGPSPPPPPPPSGVVLTGNDTPGQALTGGAGNDTLTAGHNSVVETGAGGADRFVFSDLPWNAGQVTDFTTGTDHIDISALLSASQYGGTDPIGDGYLSLVSDGSGGTKVLYDTDGRASGNTIQFVITDLQHVTPGQLSPADFIFH